MKGGMGKAFSVIAPIALTGLAIANPALLPIAGATSSVLGSVGGGGGGGALAGATGPELMSPSGYSGAVQSPVAGSSAGLGKTGSSLINWIEKNPELTQMIGGTIGGAAQGYWEGTQKDKELEAYEERWRADRQFPGAVWGHERRNPL